MNKIDKLTQQNIRQAELIEKLQKENAKLKQQLENPRRNYD
jgi:hypothetical protein